jgi:Rieske Fe-S protein
VTDETREPAPTSLGRRTVLQGVVLAGAGVALAGCGNSDESATSAAPTDAQTSTPPSDQPSSPKPTDAEALAKTSAIPVNGGVIVNDEVVVTQPSEGTFKGFSAICTHQGCVVDNVSDGVISCPCHGSQFSAADGSVVGGPAPSPLPEVPVEVQQGEVVRA